MDRNNVEYSDYQVAGIASDEEDDLDEVRHQKRRKFDIRSAKRAKQGGRHESRKKDKGFQRVTKEDRGERW